MAKKADLKNKITNNGYEILQEKETGQEDNYKHWAIGAIKKATETAERKWFHLYEDTEAGNAYWQRQNPFATAPESTTWRDEVETYLLDAISNGIIEEGSIDRLSEAQRTAVVDVVREGANTITTERYLIDEDNSGNIQYRKIG